MDREWMKMAIALAVENVRRGGGPFATVIVKGGALIATGVNRVTALNDPTAHAEVAAIREACQKLANFQLTGCEIYTSCEPCPMCLGAIYWARVERYYYACSRESAAEAGFDDAFIYREAALPPAQRSIPGIELCAELSFQPFTEWRRSTAKVEY